MTTDNINNNEPDKDAEPDIEEYHYIGFDNWSSEDQSDFHGRYDEAKYFLEEEKAEILKEHSAISFDQLHPEVQETILDKEQEFMTYFGYRGPVAQQYNERVRERRSLEIDHPEPDLGDIEPQ